MVLLLASRGPQYGNGCCGMGAMGGVASCTPGIVGANGKLAVASRLCGLGIAPGCLSEEVFDGHFPST